MASPSIGKFIDTQGISYISGKLEGKTGPGGLFHYFEGKEVIFSIGSLELGRVRGKAILSVIDLVENPSLTNPKLLNRARLLFSLTPGLGFEKAIQVDEKVSSVVSKYALEVNLDVDNPAELDSVFLKIGKELGLVIKTISHVRNHLRRALAGFRVLRDIQIPVRDGNYVLADIYLPFTGRPLPALVSSTVYGKRVVYSGPKLDDPEEQAEFEKVEDQWFSTTDDSPIPIPNTGDGYFINWTKQRVYETASTFKTFFWVPRGYAMVKIDPRGVGQTPGRRGILVSQQEANDIYDAVEWTTSQAWCTGSVALTGNSYGANCQWAAAIMKPQGLKCFIPYGTETDYYRDFAYIGGIPTLKFIDLWRTGVRAASPRWEDEEDIVDIFAQHPFYDDYWERVSFKYEDVDIPIFVASAQMLLFHHRAPYEAFRNVSTKAKHLQIVDTNYYSWPNREAVHKLFSFAEHHLKGVESTDLEPVGMQMRIGHGDWYWRTEATWEVPGTKYIDWHLLSDGTLTPHTPPAGRSIEILSYAADINPKEGKAGLTFVSKPFEKEVELAGHFTATLNISSTTYDADVVVSVWALDEEGKPVRFCVNPTLQPLACGQLRASHRATDPKKSLPWRPWHTHKEADYAPLTSGESVEVNVEICPSTARIRAGWRLRVDILATEAQPDIMGFNALPARTWDPSFHDGHKYSLHVGDSFQNLVRIPTVPLKQIGPLNIIP